MRYLIAAVLSLIICGEQLSVAADYVLRLEVTTDIESRIGEGKPIKTSDVRTLEVLVTPEGRFHGKTTWENQSLAVKGKLTRTKDGALMLDIDFGHSQKVSPSGRKNAGELTPQIENRTTAKTTLGVTPGEPLILGGAASNQTTQTPQGNHVERRTMGLRVTIVEDDTVD